ncbi:mCG13839, partial [Mus musculus]
LKCTQIARRWLSIFGHFQSYNEEQQRATHRELLFLPPSHPLLSPSPSTYTCSQFLYLMEAPGLHIAIHSLCLPINAFLLCIYVPVFTFSRFLKATDQFDLRTTLHDLILLYIAEMIHCPGKFPFPGSGSGSLPANCIWRRTGEVTTGYVSVGVLSESHWSHLLKGCK